MGVGSDAGELQQAEVFEASKTSAPVSRWSSDLKSDSPTVPTTSMAQKPWWLVAGPMPSYYQRICVI